MMPCGLLDGSLPAGASMWKLTQPWWEFILRGLLVYGFLLVMLRLTGKRQVGQLAPFDLVLLLVLSNAVQNSMTAGDNSVAAGFILVATLLTINAFMGWLTWRSRRAETFLDGRPQILVHNGVVDERILASERISQHELMASVRQAGLTDLADVRLAILENNGQINVIAKSTDKT